MTASVTKVHGAARGSERGPSAARKPSGGKLSHEDAFFFFKELLSRVWGENRETPSPLRHSLFRPDLVKPGMKF